MVRGSREPAPDEARSRLKQTLVAARSIYRAKSGRRPQGDRNADLKEVAKQARLLRAAYNGLAAAYGKLDGASVAALFEAIGDEGATPPPMLLDDKASASIADALDDGTALVVQPVHPQLNLPALKAVLGDLERVERYAYKATSPAPKGAFVKEGDRAVVRLLANFVDWCSRPAPNGGGFAGISVAGTDDGAFHRFVLEAFRVALGYTKGDADSPLLRSISNVVAERRGASVPGALERVAPAVPDPQQETFMVPPKFRDHGRRT